MHKYTYSDCFMQIGDNHNAKESIFVVFFFLFTF